MMLRMLLSAPLAVAAFPVLAEEGQGVPEPWQIGFQQPATPVMEMLTGMHDMLLYIITAISVFVLGLMLYVIFRFNERRNPTPSKTTHHTMLEVVWTTLPVLILVAICIPTLKGLYYMDKAENADMTLKVVGRQWYWSYEYPDHGGFQFDSYMKQEADLQEGEPRLLSVDNHVVVPVGKTVRVLITGADVIHNWAMPAFGLKTDAVPGKLNETWFRADREGTYRGQCSELCGVGHGFMPIVIDVVSEQEFKDWVAEAQKEFAAQMNGEARLAAVSQ